MSCAQGLALEKMDDLFGVTELVKKLDDLENNSNDAFDEKRVPTTEQVEITKI